MAKSTVMIKSVDSWSAEEMEWVGRVVIAFSHLERGLHNTPKRMRRIKWDDYKWDKKYSIVGRVAEIKTDSEHLLAAEHRDPLLALLKRVVEANDQRNALIHATWGTVAGKHVALFNGKAVDFSPKRLRKVVEDIQSVANDLNKSWKSWPKPTPSQLAKAPNKNTTVVSLAAKPGKKA